MDTLVKDPYLSRETIRPPNYATKDIEDWVLRAPWPLQAPRRLFLEA
jgi:hypothetical protein